MYQIGHEFPSPTRGKRGCVTQYERRVIFEKKVRYNFSNIFKRDQISGSNKSWCFVFLLNLFLSRNGQPL